MRLTILFMVRSMSVSVAFCFDAFFEQTTTSVDTGLGIVEEPTEGHHLLTQPENNQLHLDW